MKYWMYYVFVLFTSKLKLWCAIVFRIVSTFFAHVEADLLFFTGFGGNTVMPVLLP